MRVAMRVSALRRELPKDLFDLEMLGEFLMSDRAPGSMLLSELDGFLTGIAIGPEVLRPSEWLPLIWGGEEPVFDDLDEANTIFGAITWRYNEILREIADDAPGPIFRSDGDDAIALDWAEGFLQAVILGLEAWQPLFASNRDRQFLFLILALCADENGKSLLGLSAEADDRILEAAPTLIPGCVSAIAAFWRRRGPMRISLPFAFDPSHTPHHATKVGRNDPCPCSSGKKFKKCCGPST
jgi:uncharacterized protein